MTKLQFFVLFLLSSLTTYLFANSTEISTAAQEPMNQTNVSWWDYNNFKDKNIAQNLYKEAFVLSLTGQWEKAQEISRQAAYLTNGSTHWAHESFFDK
jgi:DTW domain-containing protein YfiP